MNKEIGERKEREREREKKEVWQRAVPSTESRIRRKDETLKRWHEQTGRRQCDARKRASRGWLLHTCGLHSIGPPRRAKASPSVWRRRWIAEEKKDGGGGERKRKEENKTALNYSPNEDERENCEAVGLLGWYSVGRAHRSPQWGLVHKKLSVHLLLILPMMSIRPLHSSFSPLFSPVIYTQHTRSLRLLAKGKFSFDDHRFFFFFFLPLWLELLKWPL